MFQLSQYSGLYSSTYEGEESTSNLQFDIPNKLQIYTPDDIDTQRSYSSLPTSDFTRPSLSLPPPDTLKRVGHNRVKQFNLWTMADNQDFTAWWIYTHFGKRKKVCWNGKRSANSWEHLEQVADIRNGKPGVMCKNCNRVGPRSPRRRPRWNVVYE